MMNIDPQQMAKQVAAQSVQRKQDRLTEQSKATSSRIESLNQLQKMLQDFRSSMATLSSKKSMLAMSAALSQDGIGTVNVNPAAQPGKYTLFVEQLATAHQLKLTFASKMTIDCMSKFTVELKHGGKFEVDLAHADKDGDSFLSASEVARAINQAPDNAGKVSAMALTVDNNTYVILSSINTGTNNEMTLNASGVTDPSLRESLSSPQELSPAKNAIVWLGGREVGIKMEQASNQFNAIDGISMEFTRAMRSDDAPLQLRVTRNDSDTIANIQSFVDAFNVLSKKLDSMVMSSKGEKGKLAAFASDSSVNALREQISRLAFQDFNGVRLADLGISTNRDRTLMVNRKKLEAYLVLNSAVLDQVFFPSAASKGVIKESSDYFDSWLNSSTGFIKQRTDSQLRAQRELDTDRSKLEAEYERAYQRSLKEYTQLEATQAQMDKTLAMLNSYFD